jgi:hypothetical protein
VLFVSDKITEPAAELTVSAFVEKLESGDWSAALGQPESVQLDFKGAPYVLTENRERFELAKDISSFANAQGGLLVMGIETELSEARQGEFAKAVNSFPADRVDAKQYRDVLRELIYPEIEGLVVRRLASPSDTARAIAYIMVPPQHDRPFLVTRVLLGDPTERLSGMLVGYFVRRASDAVALTRERLHNIMRSGVQYDATIQERFDRLEARLDRMHARVPLAPAAIPSDRVEARVQAIVASMDLTDKPAFILCAVPDREHDFLPLIQTPVSPGSRLIEDPPSLRQRGFDLKAGEPPRLVAGQSRRAEGYGVKTLDLGRDGVAVFVAKGDEDFLCWRRRHAGSRLRINPLVLAESTYLFCDLVGQLYTLAATPEETLHLALIIEHAFDDAGDMTFAPGSLDAVGQSLPFTQHAAPASRLERWVQVAANSAPGASAYRLVKEVYLWFGIDDPAAIPYTEVDQETLSRRLLLDAGRR